MRSIETLSIVSCCESFRLDGGKLCKLSVSDFYIPELKAAGLTSPFEDGCIKRIVEEMEKKVKEK